MTISSLNHVDSSLPLISIFTYLPSEISLKVLSFLNEQDLFSVMCTSKYMHSLATDKATWKKAVQNMSYPSLTSALKKTPSVTIFCNVLLEKLKRTEQGLSTTVLIPSLLEEGKKTLHAHLCHKSLFPFLNVQFSTDSLDKIKIKDAVTHLTDKGLKIYLDDIIISALDNKVDTEGKEFYNLMEFLTKEGMILNNIESEKKAKD